MTSKHPDDVKLLVAVLTRFSDLLPAIKAKLVERFGPIDYESMSLPFEYTDYYEQEMGSGLRKSILSFERLISPDELASCKLSTCLMEDEFKRVEKGVIRPVNLDPGYIELSKLVLASTKNFAHRIYMRNGIYAEVTLCFKDKTFTPLPWSYPDYASAEYKQIFVEIREAYRKQLKCAR